MTIKEVGEKYNITTDTLRYYERIGLLPPVPRKNNGIRNFDEATCSWIEFIKCMRDCGVQIEPLIRYVTLNRKKGTEPERLDILQTQYKRLSVQMTNLKSTLEKLETKINHYEDIIEQRKAKKTARSIKQSAN